MKVILTERVMNHHTNPDFRCVVVKFESKDAFIPFRRDWLPRFSDLEIILEKFIELDPSYIRDLNAIMRRLNGGELDGREKAVSKIPDKDTGDQIRFDSSNYFHTKKVYGQSSGKLSEVG